MAKFFTTLEERQKQYQDLVPRAKQGDSEAFDQIVTMINPLIQDRINYYSRKSSIPKDAMELDAMSRLQDAINNFNPNRSNNFEGYARAYIDKVRRTAYEHANIGSIPEHRIVKVNTFLRVRDQLKSRLRRMPSTLELADELCWSIGEVERMQKELKKELVLDDATETLDNLNRDDKELLHYLRFELQPDEQVIYERLTGLHNGTAMSPKDIAHELNIPVTDVYNMKNKLVKKITPILQKYS